MGETLLDLWDVGGGAVAAVEVADQADAEGVSGCVGLERSSRQ